MILKIEIFLWLLCAVAAGFWVHDPDGNYEPYTYLLGVIAVAIELFRRSRGEAENSKIPKCNNTELWKDIEVRFPNVISEMKDDFSKAENSEVRKFFVKEKYTIVNPSEQSFEYHTDVHLDLNAAIFYLEDLGLIEDITPSNCPMYRFKEHFVDYLKENA